MAKSCPSCGKEALQLVGHGIGIPTFKCGSCGATFSPTFAAGVEFIQSKARRSMSGEFRPHSNELAGLKNLEDQNEPIRPMSDECAECGGSEIVRRQGCGEWIEEPCPDCTVEDDRG